MNENLNNIETTVDLKDIFRILKKNWQLILLIFLISTVLTTIISFLIPKVYEAETTLRIKQPKGLANSLLSEVSMGNTMATQQLMSTYAEIIKSRLVISEVIRQSNLKEEEMVKYEAMLQRITIQPVKDTEILKIRVQGSSPGEARFFANKLVEVFLEQLTQLARSEQTSVRSFIGERLGESKIELSQAEVRLEEYKQTQKIVAPQEETKALVGRLSEINRLAAENQVEIASAQARLIGIKTQLSQEKASYIATSPLIEQYRGKLADLEVNLVGLSHKYTANHPEVIAFRAEIQETKMKLNQEINRVINTEAPSQNQLHQTLLQQKMQTEIEISAALAQRSEIEKIVNQGEVEILKLPTQEQELARLMRDTAVAQEIYVMLAKRHEEARISEVMQPTDVQVIDRAIAPEKAIKPKKAMNVMIAAFLGVFVGVGIAFLLEYLNKTVRTADDVRDYLGLPTLATVPDFGKFNTDINKNKIAV